MLVRIGLNKYLSRQPRWLTECFSHIGWSQDGRKILALKGHYKRSLWDWFAGHRRVPISVAEQMLKEGMIKQYIPVDMQQKAPQGAAVTPRITGSTQHIALVKCPATTYCVYMDYQPT